ncbi:MAG: histidine kinase [Bacteroidota bacterium]
MLFKTAHKLATCITLLTLASYSQSRSFSFQHYGPEDGLSNTNVQAIKQDKNDIVYLATENGVYDFDGYNFSKIKPKTILKSNAIRNIGFNKANNLIIINSRAGIYEYTKKNNDAKLLDSLKFNSVDELIIDDKYSFSLTAQIKITVIDRRTGKTIEDEIKKADNANQAFAIFKTKQNTILIGRSDGLYRFENGKQIKIPFKKPFPVYSITQDTTGIVYLGSDNSIVCLNSTTVEKIIPVKTQKTNNFFAANNTAHVSKLVVDKYHRIWFTNNPDDNLYVIENNITYDAFDLLGIDKVLINCIYKDTDDNIWIGTFNDGIYFIQNPQFQNISFTSDRKILPVNCATFVGNNIVAGTNNGLFIYDIITSNTQIAVKPDELFFESIYSVDQIDQSVVYSKLNSINSSKRSFMIDNNVHPFIPVPSRLFYYNTTSHKAYTADGIGNLYTLPDYKPEKNNTADTLISFPDYRTKIISLYDDHKSIYVGTSDGLTIYSPEKNAYKNYTGKELFTYSINDIERHNNKTYLAHENGITILEDSSLIQQVGELRLTAVKKIRFYQNKVWIATLDGMFICNEKMEPIVVYNKSNGLLSNSINDIVFKGDNCCICTNKGITVFSIANLFKHLRVADKLFITSVTVEEKETDLINEQLILGSSESDITINFSSPLFVKPNKQYYKYKYDKSKWLPLDNTSLRLTSINGGTHNVSISCSYDNINWSEPINITIKKAIPFSEGKWFGIVIVLCSLVFILGVSFLWIKRVRIKAMRRVREERQVNLLKHQAMNSLMSPHFIFNSLTSIQNYINANDSLKASEYLAKFSRLIRMIIEKASQGDIALHEELTRLNYYLDLEKERFKGKFDFFIDVEAGLNTYDIKIPNMIIQPYAENSIIHGILPKHEHGNLYIYFKKANEKTLIIVIEDDGIGYNKAKENVKAGHKSLGTRTIENILELNTKLSGKKQKVEIIDKADLPEPSQGTRITITLQI